MQCASCGQTLPERAKFCSKCGATVAIPSSTSRVGRPQSIAGPIGLVAGTITREILRAGPKAWIVLAIIGLFLVLLIFSLQSSLDKSNGESEKQRAQQQEQQQVVEQKKPEAELVPFNNMTPAQHIERAQLALKPDSTLDAIDEGLRNLDAIPPSVPEATTAETLRRRLTLAKQTRIAVQSGVLLKCPHTPTSSWDHCIGALKFPNGDMYVGEFRGGKFNGRGTYAAFNGDRYLGEFSDGKYNGKGTATTASGDKYVGQFRDNKFNGQGTYTFPNGDKYVGEFSDGKANGQGILTSSNGAQQVGQFRDNKYIGP